MNAWLNNLRSIWQRVDSISPWWRMVVLLAAFTAVLAGMIWQQHQRLLQGREVILRVQPFDPRDLLLGHYVQLQFDISRIPKGAFVDEPAERMGRRSWAGREVFVVLRKEPDTPFWTLERAHWRQPQTTGPDEVVLKGRVQHARGDAVRVEYGIERYYAPKERAQELERLVRGRWRFDREQERMVPLQGTMPPGIILKVDEQGTGIIAGWYIDGKRVLEEEFF